MTITIRKTANGFWGIYKNGKLVGVEPYKDDARRLAKRKYGVSISPTKRVTRAKPKSIKQNYTYQLGNLLS